MARKKEPEIVEANLSYQEMEAAIPKINRRIKDLEAIDVGLVEKRNDPKIDALEASLDTLLVGIFGAGTVEYERYRWGVTKLDSASVNLMYPTPIEEVRESIKENIEQAKSLLLSIKQNFEEELEDAGGSTSGKTLKAYEGMELHPDIERIVGGLYRNGHYANAIEDAVKVLNAKVRMNSGVEDADGIPLMEKVFSPKNPILKFNDLQSQDDIDEQKGFMMMFSGAVAGLRNPRAHTIIKDDPERALEFIAFISLLAKLVDQTHK